ncbi:MAG: diacylglycerol kinase [Myxococcales bacterium]|nr:diacylglycerol kinase [Myxococcales bacterium]MCB9645322.1 diacylglycerol kinase [Deltaproteobacteria bacterium]
MLASFSYAIDGVLRTLCTQRNMKIHWVSGTAVMLVGMALNLDLASRASVMFCVFLVLSMEVLNTALEAFVDLHAKQYAHHAMVAKDAAAAAVLVLAIGAMVVLADVLLHSWRMVASSGEAIVRTVALGLPLLVVEAVVLSIRRSVPVIASLTVLAVLALSTLAWFSRDEVFSLGALTFVLAGAYARLREPTLVQDPALP